MAHRVISRGEIICQQLGAKRTCRKPHGIDVHDPYGTFGFDKRAARFAGLANDFAASRVLSINRSTTGLRIRFFSVRIVTGHGRTGKSTGNTFKPLNRTHEPGKAVMYSPSASNSAIM